MAHLGICYGHNATVALIKDNRLIFCQSEERFNRIKNSTGFPGQTLDYVYRHILSPSEVRSATLFQRSVFGYLHLKKKNFQAHQYGYYLDPEIRSTGMKQVFLSSALGWALNTRRIAAKEKDAALKAEQMGWFASALKLPLSKVNELDHHLSHTYSVVPSVRAWGRALIFTLDGQGDWSCATVSIYQDDQLKVIRRDDHRNSLGYFYSAVTALMGMKAGEHEFKVMGLAPYAKPEYYCSLVEKLGRLIRISDDGSWVSAVTPSGLQAELERLFRYQRFDNIAGAIQELTEKLILDWIHFWIKKTGCKDIAVSGGVFMNVKACQRVAASEGVGRLFVMPSAADESTAIGSAVWGQEVFAKEGPVEPLAHLYLGTTNSDASIEEAIRLSGAAERYDISRPKNMAEEVARLLAENEVVARCAGPMEFGARSLGNRAILANASDVDNLRFINEAIKNRDFWMPFTPSILDSEMARYVVNHERIFAPYMCITFDSTQEAQQHLKAAIHPADRTLRPQCVTKDWNPDYHAIISAFKRRTGMGGILNTSFNLHGEPVVCSPSDAIRTVDNSGLRNLVLNGYLLRKKAALV